MAEMRWAHTQISAPDRPRALEASVSSHVLYSSTDTGEPGVRLQNMRPEEPSLLHRGSHTPATAKAAACSEEGERVLCFCRKSSRDNDKAGRDGITPHLMPRAGHQTCPANGF